MTIFYKLGNKLYINITNCCPCDCIFCIRNLTNSVGEADNLWLEHEPTLDEIKEAFDTLNYDLPNINEIVFCGYGEPMERAEDVIEIAKYIAKRIFVPLPLRLNTNGLVKLINPDFNISDLHILDSVSISLNADDANEYQRLTNSRFGHNSFNSLLDFAKEAQPYTSVILTVVEGTLTPERIQKCHQLAKSLNLPLRVRSSI